MRAIVTTYTCFSMPRIARALFEIGLIQEYSKGANVPKQTGKELPVGTQVIVANIDMHTALPQRAKPSQLDRMEPLLKDQPQKLGFKIVASPAAPCSMFTGTYSMYTLLRCIWFL